jgi:hypothetical protein
MKFLSWSHLQRLVRTESGACRTPRAQIAFQGKTEGLLDLNVAEWTCGLAQGTPDAPVIDHINRAGRGVARERVGRADFYTRRFNTLKTGHLHVLIRAGGIDVDSRLAQGPVFAFDHRASQLAGPASGAVLWDDHVCLLHVLFSLGLKAQFVKSVGVIFLLTR